MSKNKNKGETAKTAVPEVKVPEVKVPETKAAEAAPAATATATVEKRKPGRPKDPNKPVKEKKGRTGRPIDPASRRQAREAEKAAKRAAGLLKKGRPKMDPTVLAAQRAKRAAEKEALKKQLAEANEATAKLANEAIDALG